MILRKAATVSTPVMEITEARGVWSIKTSTTLKSMDLKFKLGEEFDETTPDGRQTRALINLEGGKIVCTQTAKKATEKKHQIGERAEWSGRAYLHDDHR